VVLRSLDLTEKQAGAAVIPTEADQIRTGKAGLGCAAITQLIPGPDHLTALVFGQDGFRQRLPDLPRLLLRHSREELFEKLRLEPRCRQPPQLVLEGLPSLDIAEAVGDGACKEAAKRLVVRNDVALLGGAPFGPLVLAGRGEIGETKRHQLATRSVSILSGLDRLQGRWIAGNDRATLR